MVFNIYTVGIPLPIAFVSAGISILNDNYGIKSVEDSDKLIA